MIKLLGAGPSPFASKAAMAAKFAGVDVEPVAADSNNEAPELLAANPLGKIPCLVLENGEAVFDSRVITRYLDRQSGGKLFPASDPQLALAERMEAWCDGICDAAVGYQYEMRFRPEEIVHQPWLDRLWRKVSRSLDELPDHLPPTGTDANIGSIALAATLGYLDLRYAGKWDEGRAELVAWRDAFDAAHPDVAALKPAV